MQLVRPERKQLYLKIAGALLLAGGIQFILAVVVAESQYPGYSTANNTLSDMSGSCPSIDPENPLACVGSVVLQPSAAIFRTTVLVVGLSVALSAYFIRVTLGGKIAPALLYALGAGAIGVAVFPGNAGIAHGIFSMATFLAGGAAAVASYTILKSAPMRWLSLASGTFVLTIMATLMALGNSDPLTETLGVGGVERLVVYPVVLWVIALGGHLVALPAAKGAG